MKKLILPMVLILAALSLTSCKKEETKSQAQSNVSVVSAESDTESETDKDSEMPLYREENGNIIIDYEDDLGYTHKYTYYFDSSDNLTGIQCVTDYNDVSKAEFYEGSDSKNANYHDVKRDGSKVSKYFSDEYIDSVYEKRSKSYILGLWDE